MTPPSPTIDLGALSRYLDGTASPEDHAAVEAWIGTDPARRAAVATLQAAWDTDARRLGAPYDVDAAWSRFEIRYGGPKPSRRWNVAIAAAIVAAVIGAGAAWWLSRDAQSVAQAPAMREYATPRGRRAVFRLLDGTEITLNADSRLRAPVALGDRQRDVYLEGEAYFRVVHDAARPFVVHTAAGTIRDIGTAFSVRAYRDVARERVAVVEGSVALAATALRAGQVATRLRTGGVRVLRGASVSDEVAWTRGRLVFASVPLGEAAQALSRWYDLDVRVADQELARRPVTGSYRDEPVAQVLTLITAAVGARYEWLGRSVTISTLPGAR
jgi:ferric-dicitrate binding protein FerR (iron transport regulator)